jgi:hypothetical protein
MAVWKDGPDLFAFRIFIVKANGPVNKVHRAEGEAHGKLGKVILRVFVMEQDMEALENGHQFVIVKGLSFTMVEAREFVPGLAPNFVSHPVRRVSMGNHVVKVSKKKRSDSPGGGIGLIFTDYILIQDEVDSFLSGSSLFGIS